MTLSGLHLLLTFRCTSECDHCFVFGSPSQRGTMTLAQVREIVAQAQALGTIQSIYFEGGESFLHYPILIAALREVAAHGLAAGVVSNAYWATTRDDAREWLRPMVGLVSDLSISCDRYHGEDDRPARNAELAAGDLRIPIGMIQVAQPAAASRGARGQLPSGESAVMYRGRAAMRLAASAEQRPWEVFTECTHEDLVDPERLHVDPFGNVHLCQGLTIGNLFQEPLPEICARYNPQTHPVAGPLLTGGPAELVRLYEIPHDPTYADECHLCFSARRALRARLPGCLMPRQMYFEPIDEELEDAV